MTRAHASHGLVIPWESKTPFLIPCLHYQEQLWASLFYKIFLQFKVYLIILCLLVSIMFFGR